MATAYEQQRDARIRSNNAIMEKLGINGLVPAGLRAPKGKPVKSKANQGKVTRDVGEEAARRRSSRLAHQSAVVYTTFDDNDDLGDHRPSKARRLASERQPRVHPAPDDGEVRLRCNAVSTQSLQLSVCVNRPHFRAVQECQKKAVTTQHQLRAAPWA
jgi:hypothetical protein